MTGVPLGSSYHINPRGVAVGGGGVGVGVGGRGCAIASQSLY